MHTLNKNAGFTLIEVIIYTALTTLVLSGAFVASYYVITANTRLTQKITTEEEAHFIVSRLVYALSGAPTISLPAAGNSGSTLQLTAGVEVLEFARSGTSLTLARNGSVPRALSTERVSVDSFTATHIAASGGKPAAVNIALTINGKLFESLTYLRQ